MARKLTKKQKVFADNYLETGNATLSALKAYDTTSSNTAKAIGSENLTKPNVEAYLQTNAQFAASNIRRIAEFGESDLVQLNASKDILDRAGYKAIDKSINVNIDGNSTKRTRELGDTIGRLLRRGN